MHRIRTQGRNRRTIYIERTCLFVNSKTAVIVSPAAQMARSTALPKAWSAAPASTEAIGVIPCEPTLTRLLTLLSLLLSTLRWIVVLRGILIKESRNPITRHPAQNSSKNAFKETPVDTRHQYPTARAIIMPEKTHSRFATFSRSRNMPTGKNHMDEHFILVFTVLNEAGSLAKTLNIIGSHGFNMCNLHSRPMKELMWNYYFFVELEGNVNTPDGEDLLLQLGTVCEKLKLLGTYRRDTFLEEGE